MNKYLIIALLFVFTALAFGLSGSTQAQQPDNLLATPGITQPQESPVPSATATATLSPTPSATFNPGLSATGTAVALESQSLANRMTRQNIEATSGAATLEAGKATQTAVFGSSQATGTAAAWNTLVAPTAFKAMADAEFDANLKNVALYGGLLFAALLGLFALLWYANAGHPAVNTLEVRREPAKPVLRQMPRPPLQVQVTNQSNGAIQVILDDWKGIATQEQLLAVAVGVVHKGQSLAIGQWYGTDENTGEKRPFTRAEFERFVKAISVDGIGVERRKLAYNVRGNAVLNEIGRQYLEALLRLQTDSDLPLPPVNDQ